MDLDPVFSTDRRHEALDRVVQPVGLEPAETGHVVRDFKELISWGEHSINVAGSPPVSVHECDGLWGRFAGRRTQRREGLDVPRLGQGALRRANPFGEGQPDTLRYDKSFHSLPGQP